MNILELLIVIILCLVSLIDIIIYILIERQIAQLEKNVKVHRKILNLLIYESNQRDLEKNKKNEEEKKC